MIRKNSTYISNLTQYIDWVENLKESEGVPSFPLHNVYFRGHASKDWHLQAGLFRGENINEHDCFNVASNRCWTEVSSFTNLEKLIYFQHFGLLTRLLDVTLNPFVALFSHAKNLKKKENIRMVKLDMVRVIDMTSKRLI